jgi:hypothetical protein
VIYLLDTNVLIDANRDYYPLQRVPEFWDWIIFNGQNGVVKIPFEIYKEISNGDDNLSKWTKKEEVQKALVLDENINGDLLTKVVQEGYASDLTDIEYEQIGRDAFLIAYALLDISNRCIITTEVSKPSRKRANKHIPDICDQFRITWHHTFDLTKILDFSTSWKNRTQLS